MMESGRAKYTYSKMHGVVIGLCRHTVGCAARHSWIDEHRLAGLDIAQQLEAERVQRHALRGDHVLVALGRFAHAEHKRADAVRIAEAEDAVRR